MHPASAQPDRALTIKEAALSTNSLFTDLTGLLAGLAALTTTLSVEAATLHLLQTRAVALPGGDVGFQSLLTAVQLDPSRNPATPLTFPAATAVSDLNRRELVFNGADELLSVATTSASGTCLLSRTPLSPPSASFISVGYIGGSIRTTDYALNPADGRLYAFENVWHDRYMEVYDPATGDLLVWPPFRGAPILADYAFDPAGNLWGLISATDPLSSTQTPYLQRFSFQAGQPSLTPNLSIPLPGLQITENSPDSLTIDASGNIYILRYHLQDFALTPGPLLYLPVGSNQPYSIADSVTRTPGFGIAGITVVPEPTALTLIPLAAMALSRRIRHHARL
jgi:hypothetical protein